MNSALKTQPSKLLSPFCLEILLILILALVPRVSQLNDFYTIDEAYHWPGRVERFSEALRQQNWAATNQTGHPGVTTMWLGALGRQIGAALGVHNTGLAGGGVDYLAMLRLPLACVNALAIVVGFILLRRLLRPGIAFLSVVLWATSPFLIAHSRILHLDALLTSFMTISILAMLVWGQQVRDTRHKTRDTRHETQDTRQEAVEWESGGVAEWRSGPVGAQDSRHRSQTASGFSSFILHPSSFILSAFFAGLALITKAPALILLPFIGMLIFWQQLKSASQHHPLQLKSNSAFNIQHSVFFSSFILYLLWLGVALLTGALLWPAIWVDPLGSVGSVILEIIGNGGQPHHSGNYFLGQPVDDPGLLFYPAVILLRSTPLSLIGVLATLAMLIWKLYKRSYKSVPDTIIVLLLFSLLFDLLMSIEAKKLDRYLLPIWPSLEILAAYGLYELGHGFQHILQHARAQKSFRLQIAALTLILVFQCWQLISYAPYYMSFYNPLTGGGPTAERVMLVGLGEGMDQVGAWLATRPDLERGDVLSWIPPTLAPFVSEQVLVRDLRTEFLDKASSYTVLYVRSVQHKENPIGEARARENPALYTIQIHGITYATIHQLARPFEVALDRQFGNDIDLLGFSQHQIGSSLVITPSWSIVHDRPGGVTAFVHVLDQQGQTIARVDAALDQGMFKSWQAGQKFDSPLPLALPSDQSVSNYRIVLGVYQPDGQRLPITVGKPLPEEIDGPHVIELRRQ